MSLTEIDMLEEEVYLKTRWILKLEQKANKQKGVE